MTWASSITRPILPASFVLLESKVFRVIRVVKAVGDVEPWKVSCFLHADLQLSCGSLAGSLRLAQRQLPAVSVSWLPHVHSADSYNDGTATWQVMKFVRSLRQLVESIMHTMKLL